MNSSNTKNLWVMALVGGIFMVIGAALLGINTPPLSSMESTTAVVTQSTPCTCSGKNGKTSRGFSDTYSFTYEGQSYSGSDSGCTCGALSSSNEGKQVRILFDKKNPQNNTTMTDLFFFSLFFLVGLACVIGYVVIKLRKKED